MPSLLAHREANTADNAEQGVKRHLGEVHNYAVCLHTSPTAYRFPQFYERNCRNEAAFGVGVLFASKVNQTLLHLLYLGLRGMSVCGRRSRPGFTARWARQ